MAENIWTNLFHIHLGAIFKHPVEQWTIHLIKRYNVLFTLHLIATISIEMHLDLKCTSFLRSAKTSLIPAYRPLTHITHSRGTIRYICQSVYYVFVCDRLFAVGTVLCVAVTILSAMEHVSSVRIRHTLWPAIFIIVWVRICFHLALFIIIITD